MNNEPVAFWNKDFDLWEENAIQTYKADGWNIPLYTHPAKEHFEDEPQAEELHEILQSNASPVKELTLTEDEIDDVWAACSTGESDTIDMHLFAEAILKKAQEK